MFSTLGILILWTWGLTPIWVNVVGTVLLGIRILLYSLKFLIEICKEDENE